MSGWKQIKLTDIAPLSPDRVQLYTGEKDYLATGGIDDTKIIKLERVSYEDRPTRANLIVRTGDVIVARMKKTRKVLLISPENDGLIVSTGFVVFRPLFDLFPEFLYFFLRTAAFQETKDKYAQGSTQKAINNDSLDLLKIPLPPLPVQDHIVEILQKADAIRHKRHEAIRILTNMTTSIFESFFGGLKDKISQWPLVTVELVLSEKPANGKSPSEKEVKLEAEVLSLTAVRGGRLNINFRKQRQFDIGDLERFYIKCNDTFVVRGNGNIDLLGRIGLYDGPDEDIVFPDTMIRLRFNNDLVLNEFMAYLWDTHIIRHQILRRAKTTSGTHKISQKDILSFQFHLPPMEMQKRFLLTAEHYFESLKTQRSADDTVDIIFSALLDRALTGELTAEWEATNTEWIAAQSKFYQQLPQLLLLALIRTKRDILMTALMKYAFLYQMEGNGGRRLYHFVPYHYGPFAKEVYTTLEALQAEGLVEVENDREEEKIHIRLTDEAKANELYSQLPETMQKDIEAIFENYGDLDHKALLEVVYEKYPAYAQKSKVKRKK